MSSAEFRSYLEKCELDRFSVEQIDRLVLFRDEVLKENEVQNLTRLLSPLDFYEGHVLDVIHLKKSAQIEFPCLDLGSGMGVPGLVYALLYGGEWVVCDSEVKKADFMARMIDLFELTNCKSIGGRAESYLATHPVNSIVSRAVGPVSRIMAWTGPSSTWNKLVLLKGPRWADEWKEFRLKTLKLGRTYNYTVGKDEKTRVIVELLRQNRIKP